MSRYLGQAQLQPQDVASIKLFVTNRNGAEPINVLWRDFTVRADRISGLGTIVRTVLGEVVYADPTSIENNVLVLGGQPKAPPQPAPKPGEAKPATTCRDDRADRGTGGRARAAAGCGRACRRSRRCRRQSRREWGTPKSSWRPAMVAAAQNIQMPT